MEKLDHLCVLVAAITNVLYLLVFQPNTLLRKTRGKKRFVLCFNMHLSISQIYNKKVKKKLLTYAIETSNVIAVSVGGILK